MLKNLRNSRKEKDSAPSDVREESIPEFKPMRDPAAEAIAKAAEELAEDEKEE